MKLSPWLLIAVLSAGSVASCAGPKNASSQDSAVVQPSPQASAEPSAEPNSDLSAAPSSEPSPQLSTGSSPSSSIEPLNPPIVSTAAESTFETPKPAVSSPPAPAEMLAEPAPKQNQPEVATKPPAAVSNSAGASTADVALLTDTTIIPGERVGPVTRSTSREALTSLFGEDRLSDEPVNIGEGFTEPGTVVDLGPEQSFTIVWQDGSRAQPAVVRDFGSAWQTPEGISVGTSFDELKSVLGTFQLYGFAWDYEGSLVLENSQLAPYQGNLTLRVTPDRAAIANHEDAYQAVVGDILFPSDDPNLAPLDISVYEMIVYLNGE
ncbi:MAG: hypothetical protein AAF152_05280 [Cyanobacteria bacterium P01_A01_bin.114]